MHPGTSEVHESKGENIMPVLGEPWNNDARKTPCWQCTERHPKCHATCERYLKDQEIERAAKEKAKAYAATDRMFKDAKRPRRRRKPWTMTEGELPCRKYPKR